MRKVPWTLALAIGLVALSALLYLIHYTIFRDAHHVFIYLVGDVAFVPIEVLLVTVIIHRLLAEREKRTKLEKLNMVIGAFFSEVGTKLLTYFSDFDPRLADIREKLVVKNDWTHEEFQSVNRRLRVCEYGVEIQKVNLEALRTFLLDRRDFMLRLLENPNLLEHESFTELLRGVFHLVEEVASRDDIKQLPDSDYAHIAGDIKRVYVRLVHTWLDYMEHLKNNYPYLFSLAMRTNPFDLEASPVVR
jgi:hypothetical protein